MLDFQQNFIHRLPIMVGCTTTGKATKSWQPKLRLNGSQQPWYRCAYRPGLVQTQVTQQPMPLEVLAPCGLKFRLSLT
jgi:hypothetical protein